MKKTIHDMLELYAFKNHSKDLTLMLKDYVLDSRLSRDELNNKIILDLGERFPYWNHTDLMKVNIENWFATHEDNIKRLVDTLELEYNPINTVDYTESEHEHTVNDDTVRDAGTQRHAGTTSDGHTENTVSAYDASGYQPQDKSTYTDTTDTTSTTDMTTKSDKDEDRWKDFEHHGNDGQKSYQELIEAERRLAEFNIYDWIVNQLDSEICLGVFF